MKINCTPKDIRISENGSRLASASITLDDVFVIKGLSILNGKNGLFVNMPNAAYVDGNGNKQYVDMAFPLNKDLRTQIQDTVINAYKDKLRELSNTQQQSNDAPENAAGQDDEGEDFENF